MTVSTTAYTTTVSGNGATTVFNFSFIADNSSTIKITYTDANGVQTVLNPNTYTLFINAPAVGSLWGIGGTVTYPLSGSPIASGTSITIERTVPYTQTISIANQGAFYPQAVEQGLDLLELQIQQFQGQLTNTVRAPVVDGVLDMTLPALAARANKFLLFNSAGQPTVSLGVPSTTPIGAGSIMFFLSGFASLALADAAASAVGGVLCIDQNTTLTGNTTLTTKTIQFEGGVITRGSNNLTLNNVVAGDVAIFDKAGSGTITITHGPVNVTWFGVSRDGATDDTAAINRALASNANVLLFPNANNYVYTGTLLISKAGASLTGFGKNSCLQPGGGTGSVSITASNVSVKNLYMHGPGNGSGINIGITGTPKNTVIEDIYFDGGLGPGVGLYVCSDVWVNRCYFDHVAYGVLQSMGYPMNTVKVTGCVATDMVGDFANFNGDGGGTAYDILVQGNSHLGSNAFATPQTEERFVTLTNTTNARILNNWVKNVAGDAAIHVEDVGGQNTIQGNTFIDCNIAGGNTGWIYLLNNNQVVTILDNWFIKSAGFTTACSAVSTASGVYSNPFIISGNFVIGTGNTFAGFDCSNHTGQGLISNNFGSGLSAFVNLNSASNKQIRGNVVQSTPIGIISNPGVSGSGGTDIEVSDNRIDCTNKALLAAPQTGGAAGVPTRWMVKDNYFSNTGDMSVQNGVDCFGTGNTYAAGMPNNSVNVTIAGGAPVRCVDYKDFLIGTGLIH